MLSFLPEKKEPTRAEEWASVILGTAILEVRDFIMREADAAKVANFSVSGGPFVRRIIAERFQEMGISVPPANEEGP